MTTPVVLITGANTGLGYGVLEVLVARQPTWRYLLASRNVSAGEAAASALRAAASKEASIDVVSLDVTQDAQITALVKHIETTYGRLDVLVNNAGILRPPGHESMTLREMMNITLDVNLSSVAVLTTECMPLLHRSADPKVVNVTSGISSIANILTKKLPRPVHYGASKTGLNGLTAQMQAAEWDRIKAEQATEYRVGEQGAGAKAVRFYVVQPGVTRTSFTRHTMGKDPKDAAEVIVRLVVDKQATFAGGTYWEFEEGGMKQVPW